MRVTAAAALLLLAILAAILVGRSPAGYATQDREHIAAGASAQHWTGTDDLGRDRTLRVAAAFLLGMAGAVIASAVATCLATGIGVAAAFASSAVSKAVLYGIDLFLALPWLFLLMMVRAALPLTMGPLQSAVITFLLLALLGWPLFARLSFSRAKAIRNSGWLIQGRASGMRTGRLVLRHVVPHLRPLMLSQFLILIPAFLAAEANLGTLGLGVSEPLPSWGSMLLALGSSAALASSHWVYLPVVMLVGVLLLLETLVFEVQR